jgi:hypothetical protein
MEFSEANQDWRAIPAWVAWLIGYGYRWRRDTTGARKLAILSLPCESPATGLITLGALIRDLCSTEANDLATHSVALTGYAHQFLTWCQKCEVRCNPEARRCGFLEEASGAVRHRDGERYTITGVSKQADWGDAVVCANNREKRWLFGRATLDWQIAGEPHLNLGTDGEPLPRTHYDAFCTESSLVSDNLKQSYSGLCLAGRVAGESATKAIYKSIRFRLREVEADLATLLTIHGWQSDSGISRVSYFNPRTSRFDRHHCSPSLVIADGDESFLRVLEHPELQRSDVVGVVHRTVERARLEAIGNRLAELRQWYDVDPSQNVDPLPPGGISVSVLRRRAAP